MSNLLTIFVLKKWHKFIIGKMFGHTKILQHKSFYLEFLSTGWFNTTVTFDLPANQPLIS